MVQISDDFSIDFVYRKSTSLRFAFFFVEPLGPRMFVYMK